VDCWDQIITFANNGESLWVLDPGLLEVVVEDALTITVTDTSTHYVNSELLLGLQVLVALMGYTKMVVRFLEKQWLRSNNWLSIFVEGDILFIFWVVIFFVLS